ncbi:MAG: V-type ATP synthase subunit K [Phycisphaerales bacterium]|jgi:V/A-type H+/Na+-transporting ATPase subunit K|nr:V-type ATP synthase subunit K [Phycisphaerales bacterium]
MDMTWLGQIGFALPLGLGAIGSALGIGAAGRAAAGAWAKEAREGKQMNFLYIALTGMPLSQTIYGFVLMLALLQGKVYGGDAGFDMAANGGAIFSIGLACGLGELFSAWMQGVIGAAGVRAMSEADGKPFTFTIIAMGIAETVGLFACFFMFLMV